VAFAGKPEISFSGCTYYNMLRLVRSDIPKTTASLGVDTFDLTWANTVGAWFAVRARFLERFEMAFAYDGHVWHDFQSYSEQTCRVAGGVKEAYATAIFGHLKRPVAALKAGYFVYGYAPEVQDLGEYLFRSGTYPGFVLSGPSGYDLLGIAAHSTYVPYLRLDLLLTSEINVVPMYDYSLSALAHGYVTTAADTLLTIGAGVSFNRLLSVRDSNTTPSMSYQMDPDDPTKRVQYSHAGTKVMGRLCFDPKALFETAIFGENDLKLYAEAAILGVKDYPIYYDTLTKRIPAMVGFNLPAFRALDVLAVEVEWYGSDYINNPNYVERDPYPAEPLDEGEARIAMADNVKWAVAARKTFLDHITLWVRAARDHLRSEDGSGYYKPRELITRPEHWYWSVRVEAGF
jgi:hypothetical protein